jgi:Uma2 family endonuclease
MNVQSDIGRPEPVKLTTDHFRLLRQAGAFSAYSRSELLGGELWGIPARDEDQPESDAVHPIKLRIEDYLCLHQAGALKRYGKTELIDGQVYAMNPQHRPHGFAKDELAYRLRQALEAIGSDLHVATEQSVAMPPHDEPEPDIILTTEPRGLGAIPGESVAMLVEVSASSRNFDLTQMLRVYAAAGIAEYWVVDVNAGMIQQMWSPEGEDYGERREVKFGERIEAATIEGLAVETVGIA